jgi:hypothetical protein
MNEQLAWADKVVMIILNLEIIDSLFVLDR